MAGGPWGDGTVPLIGLVDVLASLSARKLVGGAVVLVAVIAVGDYVTGAELSFSAFYLVPVFFCAPAGRFAGATVALVAAASWTIIDMATRIVPYEQVLIPVWNVVIRFLVLALVVALVAALKDRLTLERTLSRTDPLTQVANTRAFGQATQTELHRMARSHRPLTVAYIDVDEFKAINDVHGHSAGDEFLTIAANTMTANTRETDFVARLGGDEFALLLPETQLGDALDLLIRLHTSLQTATAKWASGFSIGAVTFASPPDSVDAIIRAADRVMYDVKRTGKNTVVCKPDTELPKGVTKGSRH